MHLALLKDISCQKQHGRHAGPGGPHQSQRTKQGGFSQHSLFSPETELEACQSAGLLASQLRASASCSFLFGGTGRRGKIYRRLSWPSDLLSWAKFGGEGGGEWQCSMGLRAGLKQILLPPPTGTKLLPGNSLLRARGWSRDLHVRSDRPHYY